jgi:hypothetical protein
MTYPSRTADPNGRVELVPPRKRFHTVSANEEACESEANPTPPVAPPREMVRIFPFDWQKLMSDASDWQLARFVPGNVPLSL